MAITHTFSRGWTNGGGTISKTISVSSGKEVNIDEAITTNTEQLVACVIDVSQLKGLFLVSDTQTTVYTNASGTGAPANTFTLAANVPFSWVFGDPAIRDTAGAAVTVDITALYVDNNSTTADAAFQLRALIDPTV